MKRGRPKKILTDAEIEEATRQAMDAKPVIEITKVPKKTLENDKEVDNSKEVDDDEKDDEKGKDDEEKDDDC